MGIHALVGNPKCGKTLLLAGLWKYSDFDTYYTNIKLKGHEYTLLRTFEDIQDIPKDGQSKGVFIDEMQQMGADSWDYNVLADIMSKLATQHRKFHATLFFSTQNINMVLNRLRQIRDSVMQPIEIKWSSEGKPIAVRVLLLDTDIYGRPYEKTKFWFPLVDLQGNYVCDIYDTFEFVQKMENYGTTMTRILKDKYKEFKLWKEDKQGLPKEDAYLKRVLKSKMVLEDGIGKTLAGDIINMISSTQFKGLIPKIA